MNNVDNSKELPTVLSLCTGYGGIERGLELAGLEHRVVAHVEIEAFAAANLVSKMEDGKLVPAPVWTNLKTLPVEVFRDRVSILTGGYPCQPFSSAGKRLGEEDPRHLWPYILDIIKAIRPVRCFFENVEGHISLGLREVVSDLESLGYKVAWGIFSAREVGAAHQRKRVYIMADSDSTRLRQSDQEDARQSSEQSDSGGFQSGNLADAISEGSQGWLHRRKDKERQSELRYAGCGSPARQQQGHGAWPPEPSVGRVVDGCADRVDRIRLLGNGVVPQTAAKAWLFLCTELQLKSEETTIA